MTLASDSGSTWTRRSDHVCSAAVSGLGGWRRRGSRRRGRRRRRRAGGTPPPTGIVTLRTAAGSSCDATRPSRYTSPRPMPSSCAWRPEQREHLELTGRRSCIFFCSCAERRRGSAALVVRAHDVARREVVAVAGERAAPGRRSCRWSPGANTAPEYLSSIVDRDVDLHAADPVDDPLEAGEVDRHDVRDGDAGQVAEGVRLPRGPPCVGPVDLVALPARVAVARRASSRCCVAGLTPTRWSASPWAPPTPGRSRCRRAR